MSRSDLFTFINFYMLIASEKWLAQGYSHTTFTIDPIFSRILICLLLFSSDKGCFHSEYQIISLSRQVKIINLRQITSLWIQ